MKTFTYFVTLFKGAFDEAEVIHVEGEVDPVRDLDIIAEELRLKDEETLNKNLEKLEKLVVRGELRSLLILFINKLIEPVLLIQKLKEMTRS